MKLVECVPNFSEGRDKSVIDAISKRIESIEGVILLDIDSGIDTNRTVMTLVGDPKSISIAAFEAIKAASELIRKWYRPVMTIWAVATPALQGAASASQGDGFACHINAVLLPRRMMIGTGIATLKNDEFSSCVCPPNLPPLMLEGTGFLDPICTPGFICDDADNIMKSIKVMQTKTNLFHEENGHSLMPHQYTNSDGSNSFYSYAVHW